MLDTRRHYGAYYTKSDPIINYMLSTLEIRSNMRVLEPAAGDGVFIDALLDSKNIEIDAFEINEEAVNYLQRKYSGNSNINVHSSDTLLDSFLDLNAAANGCYDLVLANPPYGAWQEPDKRKALKKVYPGLYVKETYALFLYRCITLLKTGGQLTFIIPDTFLNLHMHTALRNYLLNNTKIKSIALFPSSFFPGVNFGYANLCIINLIKADKNSECLNNKFKVFYGFRGVSSLSSIGRSSEIREPLKSLELIQEQMFDNPDHALYVTENPAISINLNTTPTRLEDLADCVTGFYSGDDKNHIKQIPNVERKHLKNKYQPIKQEEINHNYLHADNLLKGFESEPFYIPMLKGGNTRYIKPSVYFVDWSKTAVSRYKTDKKARFQNSQFYFKQGIGIPMVSSRKISAALIDHRIIDQGIVGVFPKADTYFLYLLAFFNSHTCNKLIRTINPSANNSANYLKKLPILLPSVDKLKKINELVGFIITARRDLPDALLSYDKEEEVEAIIADLYGF